MITVKGQEVTPEQLTIIQRIKVFVQYQSTKALAFFGVIYAGWALIPDDVKTELFGDMPYVRKLMAVIYVVPLIYTFYKTRMTTQTVEVKPVPDATGGTIPPDPPSTPK